MDKLWLRIFCVFTLTLLVCSTEQETENVGDRQIYDLEELFKTTENRYKNSLEFSDMSPFNGLEFQGVDGDFEFQATGSKLQDNIECLLDLQYMFKNLQNLHNLQNPNSNWAFKMIDAFGKPESGFLQGNLQWIGDYVECIEVRASNPNSSFYGNFRGQYCSVGLPIDIGSSSPTNLPMQFTIGICVPDSCKAEELEEDVQQILNITGVIPFQNATKNATVTCRPIEKPLNAPAKGVISLISIFLILVVTGSSITIVKYSREVLDGFKNSFLALVIHEGNAAMGDKNGVPPNMKSDEIVLLPDDSSTTNEWLQRLEKFFSCFCVFKNGAKILNTDASEGELLCIHGIRFLSMSWVILGHTYMFGIQQIKNIMDIMKYVDGFLFQVILQGFYSVDSFFVLSGFLLAYLSMKEFSRTKGSIAWPYFYIHRYVRLTPMYMIIIGFYSTLYLYLGSGPYWPDNDVDKICKGNWWKNLIYINNFNDQTDQCMGWAWYLANDMQFFIISPLFLISLWRWPKIGYSLIGVFMLACWLSNFFITYHFELMAGVMNINQAALASMAKFMEYFNKIYIKPYTRIAPYLVGMLTGYLLFKRKASGNPKHGLVFLSVGWTVASVITLTCVFGLYHSNPTTLASSFYNALNRTGFGLGLSWVIYVCLIGQGGPVNSILSYKFFIPLSRLTYAAYLIHPMIITGYFVSLKTNIEFNHTTMVYLFLAFMVVTYCLALPVALVLESPIVMLEKLVRKCFAKKQNIQSAN